MDQDTAQAITVIEKQMAEMNQRIIVLENTTKTHSAVIGNLLSKVDSIKTAILAFGKGLEK